MDQKHLQSLEDEEAMERMRRGSYESIPEPGETGCNPAIQSCPDELTLEEGEYDDMRAAWDMARRAGGGTVITNPKDARRAVGVPPAEGGDQKDKKKKTKDKKKKRLPPEIQAAVDKVPKIGTKVKSMSQKELAKAKEKRGGGSETVAGTEETNENWTRGNKSKLLFERLTKKWTK